MKRSKIKIKTISMVILLLLFSIIQAGAAECGDVDSNGAIDIVDALLVAQYYVDLHPVNFDPALADVDGNKNIDIVDALLVAQYYVNLISSFPGCSETPAPTDLPETEITVTLQAEDAYFSNGVLETIHSGYTGSGYVNSENEPGPYIEWSFSASPSGNAECVFTYANSGSSRPMELAVNGNTIISSLDFPATGEWDSWRTASATVFLISGTNAVRLTSLASEGAPNLDKLDITFAGVISTPEPTATVTPVPTQTPTQTPTPQPDSDAEVRLNGGTWQATRNGSTVYIGTDMIEAINAAIGSLTSGRTTKERVKIYNSGDTGTYAWVSNLKAVMIRSYTILDFQGNTMNVTDRDGEDDIVPVLGRRVDNIEIRNIRITGNPRYGIWLQSCTNIVLSQIYVSIAGASSVGLGVRIDDGRGPISENVSLDYAFVENCKHHGIETYGVDGLTIGTVETRNTGGCGLLLNATKNATIDTVNAYRANNGGGYAGFRVANNAGPNIRVNKVISVESGRGVFSVTGSHGVTIEEIDITGSTSHGVLLEDTQDFVINGGVIRNTGAEGVRIASRSTNDYTPSGNNTLRNLRISGCSYGIRETSSGGTQPNKILNNDLRGNDICIVIEVSGTTSSGNICD